MRKLIGTVLGYAALLLGVVVPITMLSGVSGMIWGCRVFSGPQPKYDPATTFAVLSIVVAIPIGVYLAFYFISLPIFASFGVRIVSKRQTRSATAIDFARSVKALALWYARLMDRLIEQEKV